MKDTKAWMTALTLPDLLAAIAVADDTDAKQRIVRLAYLFGDLAGYGDRENEASKETQT